MRSSLRHAIHLVVVVAFAAFLPAQTATAQSTRPAATAPSRQAQKFLRFVDDGHQGGELQSAIVTLKRPDGITLDLIAAIHIADRDYYAELNKRFKAYDAVLYEMVKPKDAPAPTREALAESTSTISMLHRYNNQDHSMWTAALATTNLLEGTDHDVWAVNTEERYLEDASDLLPVDSGAELVAHVAL